ncbi:MAG: ATP-binding protein [Isosphaeraceae bacterium]|nr:ATP-binding protein [Isosphaeraceae bacterium]
MSLTGRFSALFLGALGVVLIGFSTAMYVSAHVYLHRQVSERLAAALAILAAAAEVHPDGVEWEPQERVLLLGQDAGAERLRWMVFDGRGRRLDQSRNLSDAELTTAWTPRPGTANLPGRIRDRQGRTWRVSQRRIHPAVSPPRLAEQTDRDRREVVHPLLVLTVCAPLGPTEAMLTSLAWLLLSLAVGIWLLALLLCRRLSKRALAPLSRMVASAQGLDASDPGWHLEVAGTNDELDELGQAFNELLSRLHAAFERQRRFSGDASHQLRTPLTVLIGQIEVALRRERKVDEYRAVLKSALGRAIQLGQILEALLFLARAEGDAQLPTSEPVDLNRWVAGHLAAAPAAELYPDVVFHPAPVRTLWVRAHPPLLGQLLDNLLDNARKYGATTPPVRVTTAQESGMAVLAVEDAGLGIPAEEVHRVFEPFYRSPGARRLGVPGVGLGLAVVKRIAVAFGGTVHVQSELEHGCRVEVRLPMIAAEPGGHVIPRADTTVETGSSGTRERHRWE